jgi:hypothetical protein
LVSICADIYNVIGVVIFFFLSFALFVIVILAKETLPLDVLPKLSHEKLDVYQMSIQFLTRVYTDGKQLLVAIVSMLSKLYNKR